MFGARLFKEDDYRTIEQAIAEAEKKTSGEIVVLAAPASDGYGWVRWAWIAGGLLLGTIGVVIASASGHWPLAFWKLLEAQALGAAAGLVLSALDPVVRMTVPRRVAAHRVHRECLANFTAAGLHETRERNGVLLYLSELERRVQILADRGIHGKVGEAFWRTQVDAIVRGIGEGRATSAVSDAVRRIGDELGSHFPHRPDDTNELGDHVLRGPQG